MNFREVSGGGEIEDAMDMKDECPNEILDLSDTVDSFFARLAQQQRTEWSQERRLINDERWLNIPRFQHRFDLGPTRESESAG